MRKGYEGMTDKIEACAAILCDAAIERAQENPELARADFESFCNVMWTDDGDMKRAGLTREEFRIPFAAERPPGPSSMGVGSIGRRAPLQRFNDAIA
jgi:hypothetical protein